MKEYIRNRVIMAIESVLIFCMIFSLGKTTVLETSSVVAMNDNINKTLDKTIIKNSQNEIYKDSLYNPLYTFSGELTGYVGDCPLCSGYLACPPRTNVLEKGIYFDDSTYGIVRIVASSKKYPCGTIIEFNTSRVSDEPIIAIILDRGVIDEDK